MERLGRVLYGISLAGVYVGGAGLIVSAFYVAAEVIGRRVFQVSLAGANEFSSYVMAVGTAWAFGYALFKRAHIRIDAILRICPPRLRAIIDIVSLASLGGFGFVILWYAWDILVYVIRFSVKSETPSTTPLWIPTGLWVLGLALFVAVAAFLVVRCSAAFARGDLAEVQRLAGATDPDLEAAGVLETPGSSPAASRPG